jgi:hypothetical protein
MFAARRSARLGLLGQYNPAVGRNERRRDYSITPERKSVTSRQQGESRSTVFGTAVASHCLQRLDGLLEK